MISRALPKPPLFLPCLLLPAKILRRLKIRQFHKLPEHIRHFPADDHLKLAALAHHADDPFHLFNRVAIGLLLTLQHKPQPGGAVPHRHHIVFSTYLLQDPNGSLSVIHSFLLLVNAFIIGRRR